MLVEVYCISVSVTQMAMGHNPGAQENHQKTTAKKQEDDGIHSQKVTVSQMSSPDGFLAAALQGPLRSHITIPPPHAERGPFERYPPQ